MADIYQRIWDADQNENGIRPILDNQECDPENGFIKVNSNLDQSDQDLKVLTELHIPSAKKYTYLLGLKLFDNFALRERDEEVDSAAERTEVHNFVESIIDTSPMQVARDYIAEQTGSSLSRQRFYNTLMEMWFRKYSGGGGKAHLSGFEHVVIGEQDGSKAKGYHFWYKYYLDDGFAREQDGIYANSFPELLDDRINYEGTKMSAGQDQYPETVTLSYRWFAPDYEREAIRPLFKRIGGFFVGCSIEGLLALGTVRGHLGVNAPKKAIINGAEYEMKLYHSDNRRHIRTFYPKFVRAVSPPPKPTDCTPPTTSSMDIRIIAALVNPEGNDSGSESISIINIGAENVVLNNWQFEDKNGRRSNFSVPVLKAGDTHRIVLDGKGALLANKGGKIKLLNERDEMVHLVSYSRAQVKTQGMSLLF